jgi:GMP synthase-like glutamine amidotransferase
VPLGAELLATTPGANQAFRLGRTFATQFHPEVTAAIVGRWVGDGDHAELRAAGIDGAAMVAETERLQDDVGPRARALVDWFCHHVAGAVAGAPAGP